MAKPRQLMLNEAFRTSVVLEKTIRAGNPWWIGQGDADIPPIRRWAFEPVLRSFENGLSPATVLRGPRQVGKTTLLKQIVAHLLQQGLPPTRVLRIQFDELPELLKLSMPILELCQWYESAVLGMSFHAAAAKGQRAHIILDEVQNLPDWAPQLKQLVDLQPVRVLVTGSSALRIEAGRDSLAGRITTIEMGPLLLREIAEIRGFGRVSPYLKPNGLAPLKEISFWRELREHGAAHRAVRDRAFSAYSERGAYPIAHARAEEPWERIADFLKETVILRAIQHDLRMGPRGQKRDERLLEEVFRLGCRYAGQSPAQALYLRELRAVNASLGWQRILTYLKFLDGTLLLRLIEPLELRLKKRRSAYKLCLCDHALRAAWLEEAVPMAPGDLEKSPHLTDLSGHLAESAAGYFFRSILHLDVAHFPERETEPEIDYILTVGEHRIPVEVKYRRRIEHRDTDGLRHFMDKPHFNAPFGLLVTLIDEAGSQDPRIVSIPLSTLLMMR